MKIIIFFIIFFCFSDLLSKSVNFDVSRNTIFLDDQGSKFYIFGYNKPDQSMVVKIKGPNQKVILQNKKKFFNMWTWKKTGEFVFPSLFHFYSNKTNDKIEFKLKKNLYDNIKVIGNDNDNLKKDLIERKINTSLFLFKNKSFISINKDDPNFFKVPIEIPFNAQPGKYEVTFEILNTDIAIESKKKYVIIKKLGLSSFLYKFAHNLSLIYGLFCAIIAIGLGLIAGIIFRRVV